MKHIGSAIGGYLRTTDKWLLLLWTGASALSILYLYGIYLAEIWLYDFGQLRVQIIARGLGMVLALILSLVDYHVLRGLWKLYLPMCLVLVAMTFFAATGGTVRGDNQAWLSIGIGGFSFSAQPSELLKISFITTFALHIAKVREHINTMPNILLLCLHGGAHVLLIQLQQDSGSALIFLAIFFVMLFCAGVQWRYIGAAVVAMGAALPVLWMKIMSDDQKMRILVLLNPEVSEKYAWQQNQAMSALGYGGLQGTGILGGKHVYVAEAYNDFIFSFIGESSGFIGGLGVVALLLVIAFKVLYNSRLAADDVGRFICIGVFAMLVSQMVINLGMCLRLLPVIGVTLPLFSSGGTSVLSMYMGLGLVLSIYCHSKHSLF